MDSYSFGRAAANGIVMALIAAMAVGGALVAFIAWGIPWLWQLLKPWLHAITA